ncbi:MAG: DUF3644 domain-containing protein [Sulfuricurvum sp.]|nr:DUF3644 domain-containing protein [Sulfuricurvum sp.]
MPRIRRINSVSSELIKKSREAALAAVQIFNNPNITFKSESFIVLMNIAWTYLLHAHYRKSKIEYRYFKLQGTRKKFDKTKHGAYKHWEMERCLNDENNPIDRDAANNLKFLIGLRHEIEHQMTTKIDDVLSARFQACCLNYNHYLKTLFEDEEGIEKYLSFSLQFSSINTEQKELLEEHKELPGNILGFIKNFDETLTDEEYSSQHYAYRILFVPKMANKKGQADKVIEFVKSDSPMAEAINKEYAVIKETEKRKFLPKQIVEIVQSSGFPNFTIHHHTVFWKSKDAKNPSKGYGTDVAGEKWHWYQRWLDEVLKHCNDQGERYR